MAKSQIETRYCLDFSFDIDTGDAHKDHVKIDKVLDKVLELSTELDVDDCVTDSGGCAWNPGFKASHNDLAVMQDLERRVRKLVRSKGGTVDGA